MLILLELPDILINRHSILILFIFYVHLASHPQHTFRSSLCAQRIDEWSCVRPSLVDAENDHTGFRFYGSAKTRSPRRPCRSTSKLKREHGAACPLVLRGVLERSRSSIGGVFRDFTAVRLHALRTCERTSNDSLVCSIAFSWRRSVNHRTWI